MFVQTLNESLNAYTLTLKGQDPTLAGFVEWVVKNPPSEKVGPKEGTVTRRIFDYCDANKDATRKDVIASLVGQGLNPYTVMTQYQKWIATQK
jgi:hypothetical protein